MDVISILKKIKEHTPTILGYKDFSKFAVLLPLIMINDEAHILFEVRSQSLRRQPGEICFPGGRIDAEDKDEKEAAIRETVEELGVSIKDIHNVYPIDYLVTPFGMIVYPYVGLITSIHCLKPNSAEVSEVFTVPLTFFQQTEPRIHHVDVKLQPDENFPFDLIIGGEKYDFRSRKIDEYFYIYEGRVIWGLTAKILSHFVTLMNENE